MTKDITAEILSIGDELLIGQTLNTNAGWMGEQLGLVGIRARRVVVISDDRDDILAALGDAKADVVLITGGLGPTKDDITKHTLCEFFNTRLVRHPEIEEHIVSMFVRMGRDPKDVLEVNRAQADLPEACTVVFNARGTASGMWFDRDGRVFVSMPGVPYEMKGIMSEHVLPMLQERFNPPVIVHRTILTAGLGESHLAQRIEGWEDGLAPSGIKLAYLPSPGMVKLRLSAYANKDAAESRARVDGQAEALYKLIPELIFGEGDVSLEQAIGRMLKERGSDLGAGRKLHGRIPEPSGHLRSPEARLTTSAGWSATPTP
jgi:nicotinamide-nucleotide amidase